MNSDFQIVGFFLAFAMIVFFYRHSIQNIFETPKESFWLSIPIIFMGILFYIFLNQKDFKNKKTVPTLKSLWLNYEAIVNNCRTISTESCIIN